MSETIRTVRGLAVAAAAGAALLYALIGVGVLSVGTTADGTAPDLLTFGALLAAIHAALALLLLRARSVAVWLGVGVLEVLVLVGYVAMAGIREPSFEPWGLLVKACQAIVLGSVTYLVLHQREATVAGGAA